ncbi:MAG: DUF4395 domain-containing protein [Actinobacteria bacterium]|nr:DUF4395 domain-containing protein [Ilumatobacteraceae bacterium]MCX6531203.1 DUF4395 domain-containing protein [Actinomycetota bacterium]
MTKRFPFPNPANETSARLVAAGVVLISTTFLLTNSTLVLVALAYGFAARVAAGPAFSPLALFVTRVVTPKLNFNHKFVPGPPKRFAQTIGLVFSSSALLLALLDFSLAAKLVIAGLIFAALLESVFAICLGCIAFSYLMKLGAIPESVCESCNDISLRALA